MLSSGSSGGFGKMGCAGLGRLFLGLFRPLLEASWVSVASAAMRSVEDLMKAFCGGGRRSANSSGMM
jgi:hypothetical protein